MTERSKYQGALSEENPILIEPPPKSTTKDLGAIHMKGRTIAESRKRQGPGEYLKYRIIWNEFKHCVRTKCLDKI